MDINRSTGNVERLEMVSKRMRRRALGMAHSAGGKGAHIGGGFSCMEILAVLYCEVLQLDPHNPLDPERDRFLASKNHCTLAHFPALVEAGYLRESELCTFSKDGSRLIGYPYSPEIGLEYAGGSLGMALSVGIGQALAAREKGQSQRIYVLMGDGELNEGSVWEAFMAGKQFHLGNLTAIIDRNHLCYDGNTEEVMGLGDLVAQMNAFGWNTISCNGHDISDLLRAFSEQRNDEPNIIIADTIKSKGLSFAEGKPEWHQHTLSDEQYDQAMQELEGAKI